MSREKCYITFYCRNKKKSISRLWRVGSWNFGIFKLERKTGSVSLLGCLFGHVHTESRWKWVDSAESKANRESELVAGRAGLMRRGQSQRFLSRTFFLSPSPPRVLIRIYLKSGGEIRCPNICRETRNNLAASFCFKVERERCAMVTKLSSSSNSRERELNKSVLEAIWSILRTVGLRQAEHDAIKINSNANPSSLVLIFHLVKKERAWANIFVTLTRPRTYLVAMLLLTGSCTEVETE